MNVRAPHDSVLSACANGTPAAWYSRKSGFASSSVIEADSSRSLSRSSGLMPGSSRQRRVQPRAVAKYLSIEWWLTIAESHREPELPCVELAGRRDISDE